MLRSRVAFWLLVAIAAWGVFAHTAIAVIFYFGERDPDKRAIIWMGVSLIVVWCILGGTLMRLGRDRFKALMARVKVPWVVKFVVLCIVMALLEEAVTTSLTNLAPVFGGVTDAARITASKNYLEVVCLHSVIVFVPQFIAWAILLWLVDYTPVEVMLLYGLTGCLMETFTFGWGNLGAIGMWTYVYGLMVYLPACTVPPDRKVWRAGWWAWPLGIAGALLGAIRIALALVPVIWLFHWLLGR